MTNYLAYVGAPYVFEDDGTTQYTWVVMGESTRPGYLTCVGSGVEATKAEAEDAARLYIARLSNQL